MCCRRPNDVEIVTGNQYYVNLKTFQIIILHQIFADILELVIEVITPCKTLFHKIGLNMFVDVSRSTV